ncbi:MAG: hypothetical protein HKN21_15645, partial [Candidatus Eisenbacteria bacterium]|nr:hypothetical protein [Candidatus Eisenbacteria bacterium]
MAGRPDSLVVRDQIDKQEVPRVWLWAGPEAFLKEDLQERAAKTLLEEGLAELNLSRFRGTEDSADVIVSTAQTLPMMATRRLVIVRAVEGLDRKGRERLLAYVENAVPETLLILMGEKGPRDPFFAKLGKAGAKVATFWHPSDSQLATWVRLRFKDLGLELEPNLCEQILESCNTGGQITLSALAPELEK